MADRLLVVIAMGLLSASGLFAQQPNPLRGSVVSRAASPTPLSLALDEALQRGLTFNLGLLDSETASQTAKAARIQALSLLLPQVSVSVAETREELNLATVGVNIPPNPFLTIPTIAGPFSYIAAQVNVSARIFDLSAARQFRSAKASEQAAQLSLQGSRDLVAQAVANAYLLVIAGASRVDAIRAQVETDQALYNRAVDREQAGTAAGIDVLRAQVQLKAEQQLLLAQQNQLNKDKLALGRIIGLPAAQDFQLGDTAPFAPLSAMTQDEALRTALAERPDYQSAKRLVQAAEESLAAARAEWYPTLNVNGYYGDTGLTLANAHGVFGVTGALNLNLFTGGRIHADIERARAALKQRSDELSDTGAQIEVDVRSAFLDLRSAADQVAVAQDNLGLANQTLDQARDRFSTGVTDTVEVVQAQESVALANDNLISALYAHNLAKVSLARAVGMTEQRVKHYLEGK
ncbi:MAG TPA: TolC family protein [Vicinamibacterales bacterium]|nr:TolC family protein [Vicinamibacterales bacterium]